MLIVRVHGIVPESVWRPRYKTITGFEDGLARANTRIVKVFLHISKEEQARRLQERLDRDHKRWKFRMADLEERKRWDDYQEAYADAIAATTTKTAPWYIVPADRKWYRTWVVTKLLVDTLEAMDPQFPKPEEDLDGISIPE